MNHRSTIALYLIFATCMSCVVGLDFTGASWIWTPERPASGSYPAGNVTFRRGFTAANGKVPISANILITTDNAYTLYIDGEVVGSGNTFTSAHRYCVPLVNSCNVFAVAAQNVLETPAGFLAAFQISYSDGFVETIVTDWQWRAVSGTPAGFEQCAFDDSLWPAAFVEGPYPTTAPWNQPEFALSIPPESQDPGPSLQSAQWIWTNELSAPASSVPVGSRAFRKTVVIPNNGLVVQAKILIATDNEFTIYVNGLLVGSGASFTVANLYVVNFPPTSRVVIAVYATNNEGPAGVFAAFDLVTSDCSGDVSFVTDGTWKYNLQTPADFIDPNFDDSAWPFAVTEGGFGARTWGPTTVPTTNSPQSPATLGAPNAPPANVVA
ncbi:hypothetical protein C0993_007762 [Termitomyces sp. T159_Od127]|nr:hypothetical protein C0993_007762 [Termitomyces sp. T159_Od127]